MHATFRTATVAPRSVWIIAFVGALSFACNKKNEEAAGGKDQAAPQAQAPVPPAEPAGLPPPPDVASAPADANTTTSGLASKVVRPGSGKVHPTLDDRVQVHYTGWTTDGKMFDSSVQRGSPVQFRLNDQLIKGWTEGLQLMVEGEQRRFWIPPSLVHGDKPPANFPAGTLVYDVELIGIAQAPKPLPAPADVGAVPRDAKRTASGLAYKVVSRGTGKRHPTATDQVRVHYTGWTTDGKMFDSSLQRGQPATFPLNGVIPGWTEGVQLMVEGEKTRFWIPVNLAYNNQPGAPAGMLVFDVELLAIL